MFNSTNFSNLHFQFDLPKVLYFTPLDWFCLKVLLFPELSKSKEESISDEESDRDTGETSADTVSTETYRPRKGSLQPPVIPKQNHYGSFYLRMGAVGEYFFVCVRFSYYLWVHLFLIMCSS